MQARGYGAPANRDELGAGSRACAVLWALGGSAEGWGLQEARLSDPPVASLAPPAPERRPLPVRPVF